MLAHVIVMHNKKTSAFYHVTMSTINNTMKRNPKATEGGAADSSPANADMTDQSNGSTLRDTLVYDTIIDCNPSYGTTQEVKKKKEFDDDCDYAYCELRRDD